MTNVRETKEHEQNTYTDNSKSRCDATHAETSSRRKNRTWICCHANRIDTARHYRRSEHHVETDRRGHQRILPMRPNFSGQWSSSCCYCSLERRCQPLEQRRRRMIGTQREQGHGASLVVGGDRIWQGLISTIHTCTQVLLVAKSEEWALSISTHHARPPFQTTAEPLVALRFPHFSGRPACALQSGVGDEGAFGPSIFAKFCRVDLDLLT